jgi:hypothetical protein
VSINSAWADGHGYPGVATTVAIGLPAEAQTATTYVVEEEFLLLITLVGGSPKARAQLRVDTDGADGLRREGTALAQQFDADGNLTLQARLKVELWGQQRYWFNVLLDGQLITRVPLAVRYEYLPTGLTKGQ